MSQFKFRCPNCKQKIQGASDWVGREISCPTCKTQFRIPPPPPVTAKKATAPVPAVPAVPVVPTLLAAPAPSPAAAPATPTPVGPMESGGATRVAVLSPEVKIEIVRSVRRLISDKNRWVPGVTKTGENMYAAKSVGGKNIAVDPASAEATRFSLVGAVLREFAIRDVARNAQGRRRMLDQEIPRAIKRVLAGEPDPEREFSASEILGISHSQSLEALDVLETRYRTRKIEASTEAAAKKFGNVRLSDLLQKMDKEARISPDDIVIAVFHELQELRKRLEKLERSQPARRLSGD